MSESDKVFKKNDQVTWDMSTLSVQARRDWPREHGEGPFEVFKITDGSKGSAHPQILIFTDDYGRRQEFSGLWLIHI